MSPAPVAGFKLEGAEQLRASLAAVVKDVDAELGRAMYAGGLVVEAQAAQNIRAHGLIDTGNLLDSVTASSPSSGPKGPEVEIGTHVEYGAYWEFGTGIHAEGGGDPIVIVPINKKALFWPGAPHPITHGVVQAGHPAKPWLRPAVDEHHAEIEQAIGGHIRRVIERHGGKG